MQQDPALVMSSNNFKLYYGSAGAAKNKKLLQQLQITHVLNVTAEIDHFFEQDFTYLRVNIDDDASVVLANYFDMCHEFVQLAKQQNGAVLIHCQAGISRSGSIVLSYLMKYEKMNLQTALQHCKAVRPQISPNLGFIKQLQAYDEQLFGVCSLGFRSYAASCILDMVGQDNMSKQQIESVLAKHNDNVDKAIAEIFKF